LTVVAVACVAVGAARQARAQTHFGPELSWGSNSIGIGIGARLELGLGGQYHFTIPGAKVLPYAGAGLAIAHSSVTVLGISGSATNVGLNLFGGTAFQPLGKVTPFVQLRLELQSSSAFFIQGGVLF
jgi:hypothetical protein